MTVERPTRRAPTVLLLRLVAALALAALAAPSPAFADNTADEAELRFRRGVDFYRQRKFEDALAEFFSSNRLVKNRNVIMNIARCYEQLALYDEAYRYYNDVLAEDPTDDDKKVVAQALERLAPRVALVKVESEPPGTDVFVDRKDLGSRGLTPKTFALAPGKQRLILARAGYRDAAKTVELERGKTASVSLTLEFIYGHAELSGSPAGAEVRVDKTDGPPDATVPGTLNVKPGRHILNVSAPGFLATQVPIEAKPDEATPVKVDLVVLPPPTGNLVVTANHENALVKVDGKESGFTPAVIALPVGKHTVWVSFEDLEPHEESVTIKEGERTWVKAELRYGQAKVTAASKTATSVEDAPASVTVISRDEILAFGYTSLPDALRAVRGMYLTNDRSYEFVGVRGFSPPGDLNNRVLILYDGHPMNDVYAGQAYLGRENNIDLNEVDHIEVVRGPVSSLFGSAAFFGVINVVPRHDLGDKNVELSGATGALGLARGRATAGYRSEDAKLIVSGGGLFARGDESLYFADLGPAGTTIRDRDGERVGNASMRASYKGFSLLGSINGRTKDIPTAPYGTSIDQAGTAIKDQRGFLEARYDTPSADATGLGARAYYDATRFRGFYLQDPPVGLETDTGGADWVGLELRYRTPEVALQHFTVGAEFQRQLEVYQTVDTEQSGRTLDDRHSFNIASAYAADELRLGKLLLVNASVRGDYYLDSFGPTVNPRLAFIFRFYDAGVTKLMGGRSFRAPTAYERFYNDGYVDENGNTVYQTSKPSPDLKPETILTGELEHTHRITSELSLTGAAYVNRIEDLILANIDPADDIAFSDNASGAVQTEGAEAALRWQASRYTLVTAAYWVQRMRIFALDSPEEENRLRSNAPTHAFSLRGMTALMAPFLVGSSEVVYNSARLTRDGTLETGEFFWVNLGLSGELVNHRFRYFAGVQNLLDTRPQLPAANDVAQLTIPSYGRTFLLQLAASY